MLNLQGGSGNLLGKRCADRNASSALKTHGFDGVIIYTFTFPHPMLVFDIHRFCDVENSAWCDGSQQKKKKKKCIECFKSRKERKFSFCVFNFDFILWTAQLALLLSVAWDDDVISTTLQLLIPLTVVEADHCLVCLSCPQGYGQDFN